MESQPSFQSHPGKRPWSEFEDDTKSAGNGTSANNEGNPIQCLTRNEQLTFSIDNSSDDGFGPALPASAPKKKQRKLPYEKLYISALPSSPRYSKSLMHKDQLSFVTTAPSTDFLITSSIDGVVKFWKKVAGGIESVKEFRAHVGDIKSVSVSQDGRSFASAGSDKTIKIFDVITFGISFHLRLLGQADNID